MTDNWTDRLSEYLDDELDPEERRAAEAHLRGCAECRNALTELEAVVSRAGALDDRPPGRNLWTGIAARVGGARDVAVADLAAHRRRRRISFSVPQLAAAALAFVLVGAGATVWLSGSRPEAAFVAQAPQAATILSAESGRYNAAVAELETILSQNRDRLDTATVRIVERNLALIDGAIAEARVALAADPSDVYLNTHLAATMRQKVQLLRRVAELVES